MPYQEDIRSQLSQIQEMGSSANQFAEKVVGVKRRNKQVAEEKKQLDLQNTAQAKWRNSQEAAVARAQAASQKQQIIQQKKIVALIKKQQDQRAKQQPVQSPGNSTGRKAIVGKGNNFNSFLNAIVGQESGGNYNAINKDSGASGKYQIMPANIPQWSREALGHSISVQQFRSSPKYQDAIASYMLKKYYNKYGAAGAAVAWYAGPGTAAKYVRNPSGYNRRQGNYPSINAYAMSILQKMGG